MGLVRTTYGGIEESLKKLTRAFEKSSNPSFPLSEASTEMFVPYPSVVNGLLQIQQLYGIPIESRLEGG
jgi:Zn-dependent oligopeptidase